MRHFKRAVELILASVQKALDELDSAAVNMLIQAVQNSPRVFLYGAGRSGLVARAFAQRLMHLGLQAFVIGETVTPAMSREDLLIAFSTSGETDSVILACRLAKKAQAHVAVITSKADSTAARLADSVICLDLQQPLDFELCPR